MVSNIVSQLQNSSAKKRLWFKRIILLCFLLLHCGTISWPPNGFHTWRETDTATVTENYSRFSMNFFRPRVNVLGQSGDGVVGMELPVYGYLAALPSYVFGYSHVWLRLLSALSGVIYIGCLTRVAEILVLDGARQSLLGVLTTFIAAFTPLVFFYSFKIQPDIFGLALVSIGFAMFMEWRRKGRLIYGILACITLALGGGVKPTFLCVGLPMFVWLVKRDGRQAFWEPGIWFFAIGTVALPFLWILYAQGLTKNFGYEYFYLGSHPWEELSGLFSWEFYQNVTLTWPIELVLGPGLLALIWWWVAQPRSRNDNSIRNQLPSELIFWLVGGLSVCVVTAQHCATPHDYYFLVMGSPMIILVAQAFTEIIETIDLKLSPKLSNTTWKQWCVAILLGLYPFYAIGRVAARFGHSSDFWGLRAAVAEVIAVENRDKALAVEEIPGNLLYRSGLRGQQIGMESNSAEFLANLSHGLIYVLVQEKDVIQGRLDWLKGELKHKILHRDGLMVFQVEKR